MLFGLGASMLVVELIITVLVPLGVVHVTGPLAARVALLTIPAVIAVAAAQTGAAGCLMSRSGTTSVMVAAVAGALLAGEADLHLFELHSAPGILAGLATHLPGFLFLAGGLAWRAALPEEAAIGEECACDLVEADGLPAASPPHTGGGPRKGSWPRR